MDYKNLLDAVLCYACGGETLNSGYLGMDPGNFHGHVPSSTFSCVYENLGLHGIYSGRKKTVGSWMSGTLKDCCDKNPEFALDFSLRLNDLGLYRESAVVYMYSCQKYLKGSNIVREYGNYLMDCQYPLDKVYLQYSQKYGSSFPTSVRKLWKSVIESCSIESFFRVPSSTLRNLIRITHAYQPFFGDILGSSSTFNYPDRTTGVIGVISPEAAARRLARTSHMGVIKGYPWVGSGMVGADYWSQQLGRSFTTVVPGFSPVHYYSLYSSRPRRNTEESVQNSLEHCFVQYVSSLPYIGGSALFICNEDVEAKSSMSSGMSIGSRSYGITLAVAMASLFDNCYLKVFGEVHNDYSLGGPCCSHPLDLIGSIEDQSTELLPPDTFCTTDFYNILRQIIDERSIYDYIYIINPYEPIYGSMLYVYGIPTMYRMPSSSGSMGLNLSKLISEYLDFSPHSKFILVNAVSPGNSYAYSPYIFGNNVLSLDFLSCPRIAGISAIFSLRNL
ncbi:MAG: hypothetical protein GY861_21340 [bacterium]|nr:hypothetical protein [bacterium]